jgi:MoaA/NifB/PqqE/SkfB family radical SAM enzyme
MTMQHEDKLKTLHAVSPSFCLAKWLQVTIDLVNGLNHSCHHPSRHEIPLIELELDPTALHNTEFKKDRRREMLRGVRCDECEYCWKIEDSKGTHYSDRFVKSLDHWAYPHLEKVLKTPPHKPINPTYVEVMFDKLCNFSCSYCTADVSSKIDAEIRQFGPYKIKHSTHRQARYSPRYKNEDDSPYVKAFWKWFPELARDLEMFRITGGEPLLSKNTFKVFDHLKNNPNPNLTLAINSNLGVPQDIMDRAFKEVEGLVLNGSIKRFELYTSVDTYGAQAEFIRAGLNYEEFEKNMINLCQNEAVSVVVIMCTFSILSIPQFDKLVKRVYELKQIYPKLVLDISYLKEPQYLRANIANTSLIDKLNKDLELMKSLRWNGDTIGFNDYEVNKLQRIVNWVNGGETAPLTYEYRSDFYYFVVEYSKRKGKDFHHIFPEMASFFTEAKKSAILLSKMVSSDDTKESPTS